MSEEFQLKSLTMGARLGVIGGLMIGALAGLITVTWAGVFIGALAGALLGLITGAATGYAVSEFAGTSGGVSVGAYTGMALGALLGLVIGALIPDAMRESLNTQNTPMLDALVNGRFETAILIGFLLCVLGTMVGAWVGGKNLEPRKR